jgi:hypothetical protein
MTPQTVRTLYVNGPNTGGCGKTWCLLLVAGYLKSKGLKRIYVDADPGNRGTERSFEQFLEGQPVAKIDIQDPQDLDNIFNMTAKSEVDVLVDLPANASGNMEEWWKNLATPDMFDSFGIRLVTLISITPTGGVKAALNHLETVGPNGTFVICLNRIGYVPKPKPKEIAFKEWLSITPPQEYDIRTVEIGHLDDFARNRIISSRCLPSQISGTEASEAMVLKRINDWSKKVHAQFDAIL